MAIDQMNASYQSVQISMRYASVSVSTQTPVQGPNAPSVQADLKVGEAEGGSSASVVELSGTPEQISNRLIEEKVLGALREELDSIAAAKGKETADLMAQDVSPEATAGRILDFALSFFDAYQEQHPEMSADEARQSFADIIEGAIGKGFDDAVDFLSGIGALDPSVQSGVDATREIVDQGLADFRAGGEEQEAAAAEAGGELEAPAAISQE